MKKRSKSAAPKKDKKNDPKKSKPKNKNRNSSRDESSDHSDHSPSKKKRQEKIESDSSEESFSFKESSPNKITTNISDSEEEEGSNTSKTKQCKPNKSTRFNYCLICNEIPLVTIDQSRKGCIETKCRCGTFQRDLAKYLLNLPSSLNYINNQKCEIVKKHSNRNAVEFCENCGKYFCKDCIINHNNNTKFKKHKLTKVEMNPAVEMNCLKHSKYLSKYICSDFNRHACNYEDINEKNHKVDQLITKKDLDGVNKKEFLEQIEKAEKFNDNYYMRILTKYIEISTRNIKNILDKQMERNKNIIKLMKILYSNYDENHPNFYQKANIYNNYTVDLPSFKPFDTGVYENITLSELKTFAGNSSIIFCKKIPKAGMLEKVKEVKIEGGYHTPFIIKRNDGGFIYRKKDKIIIENDDGLINQQITSSAVNGYQLENHNIVLTENNNLVIYSKNENGLFEAMSKISYGDDIRIFPSNYKLKNNKILIDLNRNFIEIYRVEGSNFLLEKRIDKRKYINYSRDDNYYHFNPDKGTHDFIEINNLIIASAFTQQRNKFLFINNKNYQVETIYDFDILKIYDKFGLGYRNRINYYESFKLSKYENNLLLVGNNYVFTMDIDKFIITRTNYIKSDYSIHKLFPLDKGVFLINQGSNKFIYDYNLKKKTYDLKNFNNDSVALYKIECFDEYICI